MTTWLSLFSSGGWILKHGVFFCCLAVSSSILVDVGSQLADGSDTRRFKGLQWLGRITRSVGRVEHNSKIVVRILPRYCRSVFF